MLRPPTSPPPVVVPVTPSFAVLYVIGGFDVGFWIPSLFPIGDLLTSGSIVGFPSGIGSTFGIGSIVGVGVGAVPRIFCNRVVSLVLIEVIAVSASLNAAKALAIDTPIAAMFVIIPFSPSPNNLKSLPNIASWIIV